VEVQFSYADAARERFGPPHPAPRSFGPGGQRPRAQHGADFAGNLP